ncbi:MAG UNVERIFIED_CONTAM: hypothetical protein LVQ98_00130 [Rickettsiaceae bacterium]
MSVVGMYDPKTGEYSFVSDIAGDLRSQVFEHLPVFLTQHNDAREVSIIKSLDFGGHNPQYDLA